MAALLKDHERIQANQANMPNDDDIDIKKIKKVRSHFCPQLHHRGGGKAHVQTCEKKSPYPLLKAAHSVPEGTAPPPTYCWKTRVFIA